MRARGARRIPALAAEPGEGIRALTLAAPRGQAAVPLGRCGFPVSPAPVAVARPGQSGFQARQVLQIRGVDRPRPGRPAGIRRAVGPRPLDRPLQLAAPGPPKRAAGMLPGVGRWHLAQLPGMPRVGQSHPGQLAGMPGEGLFRPGRLGGTLPGAAPCRPALRAGMPRGAGRSHLGQLAGMPGARRPGRGRGRRAGTARGGMPPRHSLRGVHSQLARPARPGSPQIRMARDGLARAGSSPAPSSANPPNQKNAAAAGGAAPGGGVPTGTVRTGGTPTGRVRTGATPPSRRAAARRRSAAAA
jgi:hypothetical protein